ncbi:hypothetical protein TNCV_3783001 [Trichonephila clavipes]|nr:hypothetical protein TNCV_3783001 [Trichonephila clavipes]
MRGTSTGQRYVDDILLPHLGPFLNGFPGATFSSQKMLVRIQQELLRTFYVIFRLFHGLPAPPIFINNGAKENKILETEILRSGWPSGYGIGLMHPLQIAASP